MTGPSEPAQLLDVEVDHLAGAAALVADDRRPGVQQGEAAKAQPAQDQAHRRARHAQRPGDLRPGHPLTSQGFDLVQPPGFRPARTSPRRRAAVVMPALASEPMPAQPFARGSDRHPGGLGRRTSGPARLDPLRQQGSTRRRQPGILVHVHPGNSSVEVGASQPQLLSPPPGEQPS